MRRAAPSFWAGLALTLAGLSLVYLPVGDFYLFLASRSACYLLVVAGLNLALGYTGLFSFAHVALFALGAYATAIAVTRQGLPVGAGIGLALVVGAAAGGLVALATFRARAIHFAVVSLVLVFAVSELLSGWTSMTGGERGITGVRRPELGGEPLLARRYWLFVLVVTVVCVLALRNLVRSPLGRALVAVREGEGAAASVGINPFRYRVLAMAFGGAIAAVGGALFAHLDGFISPDISQFDDATLFVAMVLVGGAGTLWGPVLGVGTFLLIDRGLVALKAALPGLDLVVWQSLVSGALLFLVIVFLPRGIAGLVRPRPRVGGRGKPEAAPAAVLPAPRIGRTDGHALEVVGLTKRFGGVRAVDDLGLVVDEGTIHGLIGPNGSGKTTTVNLLTGALSADAGEIRFLGETMSRPRPHAMAARGMGRVFQRAEVFAGIASLDNVMAGFHLLAERGLVANVLGTPAARRHDAELRREAATLLDALGLGDRRDLPAASLPFGDRRLLEVARALAARPTLLILDEPATGLSTGELERLASLLARLREGGVTVLLIEHNMEFLMGLCDRVTVLDSGRKIAEGGPEEVQADPKVVEAYLGEEAG